MMKTPNIKTIKHLFILVILFITQFTQAQPGFSDGDDVADVPVAPIDDWIVPMLITGAFLLFYYYKKHQKAEIVNHQEKID